MKTLKLKKVVSLAIVCSLLLAAAAPALAAAPGKGKEEVVYVMLQGGGKVESMYVVNIFDLAAPTTIVDYGNYTEVRNMNTGDTITLDGNRVSIEAGAGRLYYEGIYGGTEIPWLINIRYFLGGQEYSAEEIAGAEGKLEIRLSIRQNTAVNSDFFDNFALQCALTLDTALCSNIVAEEATPANVGRYKQLGYTILPGKEKDISITADVHDFEMDPITINAVPLSMAIELDEFDTSELTDEMTELQDGVRDLDDGAKDLKEGVNELYDGAIELQDGTTELQDGVTELQDGVTELRDGAGELRDGVTELRDGANKLEDGAEELLDGLKELDRNGGTLVSGANQIAEGILSSANQQLQAAYGSSAPKLTWSNYASVLNNLGAVSPDMTAQARKTIAQSLGMSADDPMLDFLLETAYGLLPSHPTLADYNDALAQAAIALMASTLAQLPQEQLPIMPPEQPLPEEILPDMNQPGEGWEEQSLQEQLPQEQTPELPWEPPVAPAPEAQWDGLVPALPEVQASTVRAAYASRLRTAPRQAKAAPASSMQRTVRLASTSSKADAFLAGMVSVQYSSQFASLKELKGTLDGVKEFKEGAAAYTAGVSKAASGAAELYDGTVELMDGVLKLDDGVNELSDGVAELYDGALELADGVVELNDGVEELVDGVEELFDGSIELKDGTGELRGRTKDIDVEIQDKIDEKIDEIKDEFSGKDYVPASFVSPANGNVSSVQFVMKTDEIKIPEPAKVEAPEPESLGFFQKLKRLFTGA